MVLGISNEVSPGTCFTGRGFSSSPPQRTPFPPSLAVSLIILKIKNKPKCSST